MSLKLEFALSLLKIGSHQSQTFFLTYPQGMLSTIDLLYLCSAVDMLCNFCVDFSQWLTIMIISVLSFLCLYVDVCMPMCTYKHAYLL